MSKMFCQDHAKLLAQWGRECGARIAEPSPRRFNGDARQIA